MTVTASINISSPTGRKLLRELEKHKRIVQIVYNEPISSVTEVEDTVSLEEAENYLWDRLEENYGVDLRKL